MSNVTIGVIGAGLIGRKHLRTIASHPDFDLVGIADINTDLVSSQYPGERIFADYTHMLDQTKPDAVVIASPNQVHAEIGIACARRGVNFLLEKPVTDTLEAAAALIQEVSRSAIKTLVGHHRRHHEQVKTVRTLLRDGQIGALIGVSAIWAVHKPAQYFKAAPWRAEPGGGPILINLIHEIDFLRFVAGEIVAISAVTSNHQRRFSVEDSAGALLEFARGAIGTFFLSDSAVSPWTTEQGIGEAVEFPFSGESSYRFIGSHGSLEFPALTAWAQAGRMQDWNQPIQAQRLFTTTIDPYVAQLDHFRDVVRGSVPSLQPVEDGARTLIATLAVTEAARVRKRIELAERYGTLATNAVSSPVHL